MRKISIILLSFLSLVAYSQTNTRSPYSRYGLGDIAREGSASNRALGGTGIGLRLPNTINYLNPASYSAIDTLAFIFDFGLYSSFTDYKTNSSSGFDSRSSLNHITIGFPIAKWWKTSLGLVPYSRMGYDITDYKILNYADTTWDTFDLSYKGTGGINKFYFGNAFQYKNLSVGVNLNVLFGSLEQTHRFNEEYYSREFSMTAREQQQTIRSTSLTLGLQYLLKFSDNFSAVIGGTFENKSRLVTDDWMLASNAFTKDTIVNNALRQVTTVDTINFHNGTVKSHLPMKYGFGVSLNYKNMLLLSADYSSQQWSKYSSLNIFDQLADTKSYSFGIQYTPDEKSIRNYWKRVGFRGGYYATDTYIKIGGQQIKDSGVSLGLRIPFRGLRSAFLVSYEYGKRGTTSNNLIEEKYHFINAGISLVDIWFRKSKYD